MKRNTLRASAAPRTILALSFGAALVIAVSAGTFYLVTVKAPTDLVHNAKEESFDAADRMAHGFQSVFNFTPRVTVNGVTVIEQASSVIELATVQEDVAVHYSWSQSWLGSTKTMELQGVYRVKAGFNLRDPFRVSVDGSKITASLPAPKLLSLEMTSYKVLQDESGWWNSITPADRENAIVAMQQEARTKAGNSGLLEETKAKFKQELNEAIQTQNITTPLEITFQGDAPAAKVGGGKINGDQ